VILSKRSTRCLLAASAGVVALGCSPDDRTGPANADVPPASPVETAVAATLSWSGVKSLPVAVRAAAAAGFGGRIYVLGGNLGSASLTGATRIYNPTTNIWTSGASFLKPRDFAMAAGMADGVHLVGGAGPGILTDHRVYRPATNSWIARAPLFTAVHAAVAQVVGGKLYVIGGRSASGPTGRVQVYNPSTNSWVLRRSMPTARLSSASAVINGLIYVAGGQTAGVGTTAALQRYNPTTDTWTTLRAMPVAREALSGGNVNGQFCVAGGRLAAANPTGNASSQTYCYNPSTNAWVRRPDMITPRTEAASAVLNGALYAIGGRTSSALVSRAVTRLAVTVPKATSTVLIRPQTPNPSVVNQAVRVTLFVEAGNEAPTGSVTITVSGGAETCTATLVMQNGLCDVTLLAPGPGPDHLRIITATYSGDANCSGATATVTQRVDPSIFELVSVRDHIPGSFLTPHAMHADRDRIYLGSYQGTLFVLARDRAADFPIVQTIDIGMPITAIRGDADRLYLTAPDGQLRVFAKEIPLRLVATRSFSTYLGAVTDFGDKLYLGVGFAELAVDRDRLYLAQLSENDVVFEVDKATLEVLRTLGQPVVMGETGVYDRSTGAKLGSIPFPPSFMGPPSQPILYLDANRLFETVAGCCGMGINIISLPSLVESQFIPEAFTNTVVAVPGGFWSGLETGEVGFFDTENHLVQKLDLKTLTGHTGIEEIEIRALWADGFDDLVFAGSSWGNDASRGPTLPSFFVLRLR
jgi:N-acetylneuraminic acid mutarotase